MSTSPKSAKANKSSKSPTNPPPTAPSRSRSLSLDMEIPPFMLWVKDEPFLFGVLSPSPCAKLGFAMLRKVAEYCRTRSSRSDSGDYFPHLTYTGWGHISKHKLQLPVELSWALVRSFHLVNRKLDEELRTMDWDKKFEEIRIRDEDPEGDATLPTLQFLLFLYIQSYFRLQSRYGSGRKPSFDEGWPGGSEVNRKSSGSSIGSGSHPTTPNNSFSKRQRKTIPEHGHSGFVEMNLEEIVTYLDLACSKPKTSKGKDKMKGNEAGSTSGNKGQCEDEGVSRLPLQVVEALSFILGAASLNGNPRDTEFTTLGVAVTAIPGVSKAVDFRKGGGGGTVDRKRFILWVKFNLKLNPWGPTSAAVPQHGVDYSAGIWQKTNAPEVNRIYWNTQLYPKGWHLISTVNSQVLHVSSVQGLSSLKIHRCSDSYIYVPGSFCSILVEKCDHCTLFLGPAGKFVKFVDCSNLHVSAVGRSFIFQDVGESSFNLLTPSHPLITGNKGKKKVILGPYNTFYPNLERDMERVGLDSKLQKWNRPLELDRNGLPVNLNMSSSQDHIVGGEEGSKSTTPHCGGVTGPTISAYETMRSEAFTNFVFPFGMEGKTVKNPVVLPRNYEKKLNSVGGIVVAFKNEVRNAKLSEEKKVQLNAIVEARFHTWLKKQGHLDHVRGLRSMQKTIRSGTTVPILETRASIREEKRKLGSRRDSEGGVVGVNSSIYFLDGSCSGSDPEVWEGDLKGQSHGGPKESDNIKKNSPSKSRTELQSSSKSKSSVQLDDGLHWNPIF